MLKSLTYVFYFSMMTNIENYNTLTLTGYNCMTKASLKPARST